MSGFFSAGKGKDVVRRERGWSCDLKRMQIKVGGVKELAHRYGDRRHVLHIEVKNFRAHVCSAEVEKPRYSLS